MNGRYFVALFVKDPEVDRLAKWLMTIKKVNKTEAVRQALLHELERERAIPSLVELGVGFCRALRARADPANGIPADKAFIDGLYGNE
jgi:antitoxin VapB